MMLEFGFGQGVERVEVPQDNLLGVLTPNQVELGLTGEAEVRRALEEPIGAPRLRDMLRPGKRSPSSPAT